MKQIQAVLELLLSTELDLSEYDGIYKVREGFDVPDNAVLQNTVYISEKDPPWRIRIWEHVEEEYDRGHIMQYRYVFAEIDDVDKHEFYQLVKQ